MNDYIIFTDGDVDLPAPYDREVSLLPQYYYFEESKIYGDEQVLAREDFFDTGTIIPSLKNIGYWY